MLSLLSTLPVPPVTGGQVSFSPFITYLLAALNPNSTTVKLAPDVEQDLYAVLGNTKYATFVVNDGMGSEAVDIYFVAGVLTCSRAAGGTVSYPVGSCLMPVIAGAVGPIGPAGAQGSVGPTGVSGSNGTNGTGGSDGSTWFFGTAAIPSPTLGNLIDKYLNTTTGDVFEKTTGSWVYAGALKGAPGPAGASGADGSHWESGAGVPLDTFGSDGWLYVNSANGDVYKKTAGHWAWNMNIAGAQGIPGNNGVPGSRWFFGTAAPTADIGTNIDYYLQIDSADWWQKSSGTWAIGGSLKGVPGTAGSNGAPGYSQAFNMNLTSYTSAGVAATVFTATTAASAGTNTITGASVDATGNITLNAGAYALIGSGYVRATYTSAGQAPVSMVHILNNGTYQYGTQSVPVASATADDLNFFMLMGINDVVNLPSGGVLSLVASHNPTNSAPTSASVFAVNFDVTILRIQ